MKKKVIAGILGMTVLGTSMLSGCSGGSSDKDAGEMVLYTWEAMFPQEVLDGFEEETGIKIIYSNFDTDETMLEKLAQAEGGGYDVVIADDYILETVIQQELAQKLDKEKLENIGNVNPLYQGQFYDPEDAYTVPYGAGIPLIVYDPEQVDIRDRGLQRSLGSITERQHCPYGELPRNQWNYSACHGKEYE